MKRRSFVFAVAVLVTMAPGGGLMYEATVGGQKFDYDPWSD